MMNLKRRAVRNFPVCSTNTLEQVKALRRQWLAAVQRLGDQWVLLHPVTASPRKNRVLS